ncbi:sensor histidine kinase [Azohydromonas caseinilytica]|uniref:histidine kinase n=1 Tax=Azohydromonas caseinilytica TaxID=2728836 RepID=A0A848FGM4_9BURK|nr:HAMP domain-containing sensor histidine kinase [Azohydromonas caseinilytica]NML18005.1 HAMP domain-containing histidine kinase [Azohydromonas caseinilytica]
MKSLYLRVWLTVVAVLALFALGSGWVFQQQMAQERGRFDAAAVDRLNAWGELLQHALPPPQAPAEEQAQGLREWSERLRVPLALDDAQGRRLGEAESFGRRAQEPDARVLPIQLDDGRTLWLARPPRGLGGRHGPPPPPPWLRGTGLLAVLVLLFVAVAAGAYPVVRRLTRRLEALQAGVERFGAGALAHRVDDSGRDEVAALARSFNRAAERIETLLRSHQSLLANASHELRSPLARLKMAVSLLETASPGQQPELQAEIHADIAELDALVEEVLLASRLDARPDVERREADLLALAAEECARVGAELEAGTGPFGVQGEERLLRRALRNLLENARRYGGDEVLLKLEREGARLRAAVCDRGPGVPEDMRERIFEPFFRLPGHAEQQGGIGLGLSLVRQIAQRHDGSVRCEPRDGGGSRFVLELPAC